MNDISWSDAELPFSGIKASGYGRELRNMGIQEFIDKKLVRTLIAEAPAERSTTPGDATNAQAELINAVRA
ncbi:MAG: hypothetical protein ABSC06_17605 [Rhodopila sp.]